MRKEKLKRIMVMMYKEPIRIGKDRRGKNSLSSCLGG
jgi:hypothetical protein